MRKLFSPIKSISIGGSYAGIGGEIGVEFKDSNNEPEFESFRTCKENFYKAMKGSAGGKPIVYFIDDIDRMSDENIALLFQLVKSIANFPNVIYVLAYDREIVVQALDCVQKNRGEEYLHKIIQIPFKLPPIEDSNLIDYFEGEFRTITSNSLPGRENESIRYCFWIEGIGGCLKSIRDCNQLLTVFQNKYMALRNDCNVLDLLGISAIQVFAPVSCALLQESIVNFLNVWQFPTDSKTETVKGYLERILDAAPAHFRTAIGRILSVLFPRFGDVLLGFCGESRIDECFRIDRLEYVERYFKLHVSVRHITEQEVHEILQYKDIRKIDGKMKELNKELKLTYFLERATADWDENTSWESACLFLSSVSQMDLVQEDAGFNAKRIHNVAIDFFDKVVLGHKEAKKKHESFKLFVENREINLGMICECVRQWVYDDMGFMVKYKDLLAGLSQRIKDESLDKSFSDNKFLNAVVYLWYKLDKESCREFLNYDDATRNAYGYGSIRAVLQSGLSIGSGEISRSWKLDECFEPEIQDNWSDNAKALIKSGTIQDKHILQDIVAFLIIQERHMHAKDVLMEDDVDRKILKGL